jgi:hypothetical protein
MNDDLDEYLRTWQAPAASDRAVHRIATLLDDDTLPGPLVRTRRQGLALPVAYAAAVATVVLIMAPRFGDAPSLLGHDVRVTRGVVEVPGVPASAQSAATAVSAIDLERFELVAHPRIRVNRRTP